jgi:radical SAM/SPASM domain FxsB family protein
MKVGVASELPAIDEFIVKVASRCNIDCDYCYEFNHGDDSWRRLPPFMTPEVGALVARRIAEHALRHGLPAVSISLHGGEPLVLGAARLEELLGIISDTLEAAGIEGSFGVQTNGILLTESTLAVLKRYRVNVGLSLDGGRTHNDRHRRSKLGNTTFARSAEGIRRLVRVAPDLFAGVLAVIDLNNNPADVVDELYSLGARNVDLLLPHHNWSAPPPRSVCDGTEYADWYNRVWLHWTAGRWPGLNIRFLENLVRRLVGHPGIYEQMSLSPANLVTVNTGGGLEQVDTLKSAGPGAQGTGLHLTTHCFDDVLLTREYAARCFPMTALCRTCTECEVVDICVGGYLPHRFEPTTGFDNPSVYCGDLKSLIRTLETAITK